MAGSHQQGAGDVGDTAIPVDTRAQEFADRLPQWERCRDMVAGNDAIKAAGEKYLPRLSGQGIVRVEVEGVGWWLVDEYANYKARANVYNATGRTVQGLLGALFRKPPTFDVPTIMDAHLADITLTAESATSFAQRLTSEILTVGIHGVLVDMPVDAATARPYWVAYRAEQILSARMINMDGVLVLGRVVLEETVTVTGEDEFVDETQTRWRVLELDNAGLLRVRIFTKTDEQAKPVQSETLEPAIRGQRLNYIPFTFFGPTALTPTPEKPPLLDLVDVNLSHYRTSADLEEGRHKLALPTPWAVGFPVGTTLRLGAGVAHISSNPDAKMGMLEFTGAGLGELRLALEEKQAMMASIGARLLEAPKSGVEAAEAIRLRTSGEQSFLMTMAATLSAGLTQVLQHHARWMLVDEALVTATVNDDFIEQTLTPQQQEANLKEFQAGVISYPTWFYRSMRGEMMRPNTTPEEEMSLIESERPLAGDLDLGDRENDEESEDTEAA